jgi:GT2 family glycosyltransferase
MSTQNIEFLILGFNGQSVSLACLKSITTFAPSTSVTFLDNGSSEEMHAIKTYISAYPNWHYLRSETNLGVTKGRNSLLSRSSGDILVFMDNDAQLTGPISEILIDAISNEQNIGVVGKEGILFDPDLNDYLYRSNMQVDAVPGYFQAFSRRFYLEVGMLDERFDLYWMEDMDYCLEGKKKGFVNKTIENLPIEHLEHISHHF